MILPEKYLEKMQNLLRDEFDDYIESFNEKRHFGIRANTLKITPDKLTEILNYKLEPISWCKEGFYYYENDRPAKSPYYNAGLYYIQEPSAMSAASMLEINSGDYVLDLCAAPGGKTTQAAAKLQGKGIIVTNDISASRCKALLKNVEVAGVSNAIITNETPERLAERFPCFFDKIIVDAPCSGEGMFRKDSDAVKSWEEHKTELCCSLQREILKNAALMCRPGGTIAYSTCTFAPEENEAMIEEFLSKSDFELLEVSKECGFDRGRYEWTKSFDKKFEKCGRLWPHKVKGEGHFLALMKKSENNTDIESNINKTFKNIDLKYFHEFMNDFLNIKIDGFFEMHGTSLFSIPLGINLDGLRVVRSGLYLGEIKTKRFEPSQAFAMTLKKENAKYTIDFNINDTDLIRYLKGESFPVSAHDGWNLVCLEGYPLGWGKVQNKRLKNKYLPGWRI